MKRLRMLSGLIAAAALTIPTQGAMAADPVAGKDVYINSHGAPLGCAAAACHGSDPGAGLNGIKKGANNPAVIQNAIDSNKGSMGFLKPFLTATDIDNVAAYIANPNAGTPAAAIKLSTATISFGGQTLLTTSAPMVVTVSNTGSANLTLQTLAVGGTNAGDFARAGTCAAGGTLAPNGSCTVALTFTPQAIGTRSGSLSITHNATGSPSSVALSGTGANAPTPAIGLSAASLAFGDQLLNTPSTARSVTVTNTGSAALTLNNVALGGANAGDFALSGNCAAGTNLAPQASCTAGAVFTPSALGARSASITISSNASGSPHAVPLSGNGVAVGAPAVKLTPSVVNFGNQLIGMPSPVQSITLTNSGGAALNISNVGVSGTGFAHSTNCPASLAPTTTCAINLTFTPAAAGAATGTLTVATNATGSPHTVGLSGTGITEPAAFTRARMRPEKLEFRAQLLNTPSKAREIMLRNEGQVALRVENLRIGGKHASDFAQTSNCPIGGMLAPQASCTIRVVFTPTRTGDRKAQLNLSGNVKDQPKVELKGTGVRRAGEDGDDDDDKDDD